jgi:preprotein translocase subunit SecD
MPTEGATVRVELTPDGGRRFEEFTGANIKRRLAILVDGRVASAPVILSRIPGGIISITMGAGDRDQQRADAERLVHDLLGR